MSKLASAFMPKAKKTLKTTAKLKKAAKVYKSKKPKLYTYAG